MAKCTDQKNQNITGGNLKNQVENAGALQVNIPEDSDNIFNPNYALSALQTYNTFNNVANKMFGIDARWFRAIPQQRSKDVIFQEYTLSCVEEEPLCLKVIIPDGNFPDSKYQFDLMGLEYEIPLEINIDKKYWEEIAGYGSAPQKKDVVYLPMPNKLYQVESSFLKRGFMEQETTWVINLRKFMSEASRKEGEALQETIDMYTTSEQELFGDAQNAEYEKLTDDKQMSPFNSTSEDKYKILDSSLSILSNNIEFYGTIVAQNFYNMATTDNSMGVQYINPTGDVIKITYDRSLIEWVMPQSVEKQHEILSITPYDDPLYTSNYKIKVKVNGNEYLNVNDTLVISRPGALNFYANIVTDVSAGYSYYPCQIDETVVNHLASIKSNWYDAKGYKMQVKPPISMIKGTNDTNTGISVDIFANQYIKVIYGAQEHIAIMDDRMNDNQWYGVVVNLGNTWNQYNTYVWEEHPTDSDSKLKINFYETLRFTPEHVQIDQYSLNRSPAYITNIRLFKTTIEEEKQTKELLSYFSKDADQALILDNADAKFSAPYISKQK